MHIIKNISVLFLLSITLGSVYAADHATKQVDVNDLVYVTVTDVISGQQTPICIPPSGKKGAVIKDAYKHVHPLKANQAIDILYRDHLVHSNKPYNFAFVGSADLCVYCHKRPHKRMPTKKN